MKRCFKCGDTKPLTEFYVHGRMADGHLNKCKDCTKADVRASYYHDHERSLERERERSREPSRRDHLRVASQKYRERHPDKVAARTAVKNAIARGDLSRGACERCSTPNAEAHHEDYSEPLKVRWLCRPCHRAHHRNGPP